VSAYMRFAQKAVIIIVLATLVLISAGVSGAQTTHAPSTAPAAAPGPSIPAFYDFPVPDQVILCGEKLPLTNRDVYERLDMELTIAAHAHAQVFLWLKRAGRYFPHIERRLAEEGLPDDLKYLAVAESDLRSHVSSPARACGTWQFMPSTGTIYGLRRDKEFDDRYNFYWSTEAAIKYLKRLHRMFGKWSLAMAAYNCGEGRVQGAIKEQGVRDYYQLNLPYETERYVLRIAAIKIILENPEKYGFHMPADRAYKPIPAEIIAVNLSQEVHITDAARSAGLTYKQIKEMNPEIKGDHLPKGTYTIRVPLGSGKKFSAFLGSAKTVPSASPPPKTTSKSPSQTQASSRNVYVVKKGDTLAGIARSTGVPVNRLKQMNNIRGSQIHPGQKLKLAK
jgi:membrane-bound lytic murein transglycosylase D